jgi:chorismate-pyruvate lyase
MVMARTDDTLLQWIRPLVESYGLQGLTLPQIDNIGAEEIPDPYRSLLAHRNDMTPTLEEFHGDRIRLDVLQRRETEGGLLREVLLLLNQTAHPVEYGAISIHLDSFDSIQRKVILEGVDPFGRILQDFAIEHEDRPSAFFRVQPDDHIQQALKLDTPVPLFGRRNTIVNHNEIPLAEIVEILAPVRTDPG